MVPPILEYLGALTLRERPEATLQLLDANQSRVTVDDVRGDLVGISGWTATAPWAYRFADACRARGVLVVEAAPAFRRDVARGGRLGRAMPVHDGVAGFVAVSGGAAIGEIRAILARHADTLCRCRPDDPGTTRRRA